MPSFDPKRSDNEYVSSVVDNLLAMTSEDDWHYRIKKYQALILAKRFVQKLSFLGAHNNIRAFQADIPENNILEVPEDYVDYVRLSTVDDRGWLIPIFVNYDKNIAYEYLRDHEEEVIYDADGFPIKTTGARGSVTDLFAYTLEPYDYPNNFDYYYGYKNRPGIKGGYFNTNGEYRYDDEGGYFWLKDIGNYDKVVLEYISDPLLTVEKGYVTIHKYWIEPLLEFIKWQFIKDKANVPMNAIQSQRREYYNAHRIAKRIGTAKPHEIIQFINKRRSFFKW